MIIDADFPGGNIIVERMEGDDVFVRQDLRDTSEWWFWWAFRVTGAGMRTLTFHFSDGDVFTTGGPCMSTNGLHWLSLGRADGETSFTVTIPSDVAYFALAPLYTVSHLDDFLAAQPAGRIEQSRLCVSEHGRAVDLLRVVAAPGGSARTVVLTARMHACETMASFVLEGMIAEWLTGQSTNVALLRERYSLVAIPLVDIDGVEAGDQGKHRSPHDHNRDFGASPRYAPIRALQYLLLAERDRLDFYLDLHCPWIRYGLNETAFFLGLPEPWETERQRFAAMVEREDVGSLPFHASDTIGYGMEWNQGLPTTSTGWVQSAIAPRFAGLLEFPYAMAHPVTPQAARAFGATLTRAMGEYLAPE